MTKVRDIDRGFKAMRKRMVKMQKGPHVKVGVQGEDASAEREGDVTNAMLAAIHEFGSANGTIPQRSFMRGTVDREKALFDKLLENAVKSAAVKGDLAKQLGIVGVKAVAEMRRTIDQSIGISPIKEGSSTPLIDTGVLKGSITHKVQL
jgi:hypothetical protein